MSAAEILAATDAEKTGSLSEIVTTPLEGFTDVPLKDTAVTTSPISKNAS